ncbi:MAG TPA: DUF2288 domain-containing protein [Sulfuricella sp.]|nr:DUF2288 domain-containing protein [Sulfuricella sp.]
MKLSENPDEILRAKLNLETSRIAWAELLRFFAAGNVIAVDEGLDLIEVAVQISNDNKAQIGQWLAENKIEKVSDAQAKAWLDADATLWAVVVNPWILVQYKDREAYH